MWRRSDIEFNLRRQVASSFERTVVRRTEGSRDGAVVRALASHQCVPGSIPGPGVICLLSCCWFSSLLQEVFLRGYSSFPLSLKTYISKSQFDPGMHGHFWTSSSVWTPRCSVGKQITFTFTTAADSWHQDQWFEGISYHIACRKFGTIQRKYVCYIIQNPFSWGTLFFSILCLFS